MSRDCCRDGKCWECQYFRSGQWGRDAEVRANEVGCLEIVIVLCATGMYLVIGGTMLAGLYAIARFLITGETR